jgi:hypothetical protein
MSSLRSSSLSCKSKLMSPSPTGLYSIASKCYRHIVVFDPSWIEPNLQAASSPRILCAGHSLVASLGGQL